jgi:hypothetical protein
MLQHFKVQLSESPIRSRGGIPCVRRVNFELQNAQFSHFPMPISVRRRRFRPNVPHLTLSQYYFPSSIDICIHYAVTPCGNDNRDWNERSAILILLAGSMTGGAKIHKTKVVSNLFLQSDFYMRTRRSQQLIFHMPTNELSDKGKQTRYTYSL